MLAPPRHKEWVVTGRIFEALPTQTDTVTLIYRIPRTWQEVPWFGKSEHEKQNDQPTFLQR